MAGLVVVGWLLTRQLGSLVGGLSANEMTMAAAPVGWHGIFQDPLYLPLKLVQSVVFWAAPDHGQLLTRLPNAIFGGLTIFSFAWLIWLWHGTRTAILSSVLFATSAWTLHVSRLASFDVLYLWALPTLLVIQVLLHRHGQRSIVWYGSLLTWGLMLYVPGMIWLIALQLWHQRTLLTKIWRNVMSWRGRILSMMAILIWLPLLAVNFTRPGQLALWLGLSAQFPAPLHLLKEFAAVFVHLFIRGPQYPELWLARAPILDGFALLTCGLGVYFYAKNWRSSRSLAIGLLFGAGVILIALGGPVGLSLLVPLLYITGAAGIAYLLREWLKVFPRNPLARSLGIGLVTLAVVLSGLYNWRAYFVAWPHQATTQATFRDHR